MAVPRFFATPLDAGNVTLDAAESRHAAGSFRLRVGDEVELFDGAGATAVGRVVGGVGDARDRKGGVRVAVERVVRHPPPARPLTLIVAGCKGPRLSYLVEKCTELGTARIAFADFERSVVRVSAGHVEKLRRTAIEASKQCGRAWLPEISAGGTLADLTAGGGDEPLFVAHLGADATPTPEAWSRCDRAAVVIGPEGGLTDDEVAALTAVGGRCVRLAEHILRVETAAACAAALWGMGRGMGARGR